MTEANKQANKNKYKWMIIYINELTHIQRIINKNNIKCHLLLSKRQIFKH